MPNTSLNPISLIATLALLCTACSTTTGHGDAQNASQPASAASSPAKSEAHAAAKPKDGKDAGAIVGTPAPDSKFAKLKIGMEMNAVQDIMGRAPDRTHTHESGKRWIPFYFGNDARRLQALYKGEGCLTFTGGNVWGSAGGNLIQITVDPSGACYQP